MIGVFISELQTATADCWKSNTLKIVSDEGLKWYQILLHITLQMKELL